jgi:hypothetical protein
VIPVTAGVLAVVMASTTAAGTSMVSPVVVERAACRGSGGYNLVFKLVE